MSCKRGRTARAQKVVDGLNKMERRMYKYDRYAGLGMRPAPTPPPECVTLAEAAMQRLNPELELYGYRLYLKSYDSCADANW